MKATVKKIKNTCGDTFYKVFKGDEKILSEDSFPYNDAESEKEALRKAMELAKNIEQDISTEEIVYQTGGIQPIDYFLAANMSDEQLDDHLKNINK